MYAFLVTFTFTIEKKLPSRTLGTNMWLGKRQGGMATMEPERHACNFQRGVVHLSLMTTLSSPKLAI